MNRAPYCPGVLHTNCSGGFDGPAWLLGEPGAKAPSSVGQHFNHRAVPKSHSALWDRACFLHALYLCAIYLGLVCGEEWGCKEEPET